ncbi:MAG: hypothetical protein Q6373_014395 [Candidatus Sigynarchaeota archaeon]
MTRVKSISADAGQFVVDFEDVVWGQPAAVIIDKPSCTISVVYNKKVHGQQKVESFNFDDIVSFRIDIVGHDKYYYMIVLETTNGRHIPLIPVAGTTFGLLKDAVVQDLFTRMNAYIPATRQLPIKSKRQVDYPETSDGSSVARIDSNSRNAVFVLFFTFVGMGIFAITGGLILLSMRATFEGWMIAAISILLFGFAIGITEVKSVIIYPEFKQLVHQPVDLNSILLS